MALSRPYTPTRRACKARRCGCGGLCRGERAASSAKAPRGRGAVAPPRQAQPRRGLHRGMRPPCPPSGPAASSRLAQVQQAAAMEVPSPYLFLDAAWTGCGLEVSLRCREVSNEYPDFFYYLKYVYFSDTSRIHIGVYPRSIHIRYGIRYGYVSFVKYPCFIGSREKKRSGRWEKVGSIS